jgi:hypothetical protein
VGLNCGGGGGFRKRCAGDMGAGGRRPVKGDFSPVAILAAGRKKGGKAEGACC